MGTSRTQSKRLSEIEQPILLRKRSKSAMGPSFYDKWLLLIAVSIISIGLVMMTSASIVLSDRQYHQPFYYLYKQLIYLGLGIILGNIISHIPTEHWEYWGAYLLLGTILLLACVFIPGMGHGVNGSIRWIGPRPFSFQVSALGQFSVIVFLAGYLKRRNIEIQSSFSGFIKPMLVLGVIAILLLREPDFGSMVVMVATALGMMFLAGMQLRHFISLLTLVVISLYWAAISAPYRLLRLTSFLNPWGHSFDSGYQLVQSLIAFGRGGWMGVGLGNSVQKMFYLPEASTDFLFAVIAEELGLIGIWIVMALFTLLIIRCMMIGKCAQRLNRHFSGFLAYGIGLWIAIQFMVSIGVNSGLLPTKGLTLPLMSYGGSSLLMNCIAIALLFRIDYENRFVILRKVIL